MKYGAGLGSKNLKSRDLSLNPSLCSESFVLIIFSYSNP